MAEGGAGQALPDPTHKRREASRTVQDRAPDVTHITPLSRIATRARESRRRRQAAHSQTRDLLRLVQGLEEVEERGVLGHDEGLGVM